MKYSVVVNGKMYEVDVERVDGEFKTASRPVSRTAAPAAGTAAASTGSAAAAKAPVAPQDKGTAPAPAIPAASEAPVVSAAIPAATPAAAPADGTPVRSPMPGSVFDIRAAVGQTVAAGEVILVLEAMKMEIEVVAPCAGRLASLSAAKGDVVETDTLLAVIQ